MSMSKFLEYIGRPLKKFQTLIFNVKERCYHRISQDEIIYIKNTNLFSHMKEIDFLSMLKSVRLVKYNEGDLILREGEIGNELFIITEGFIRVFTRGANGIKISLKKLSKGDYFGEQAILGEVNKTRNSNIEAITDVTLISINAQHFSRSLLADSTIKSKLERDKYTQALNIMSLSSGYHNDIISILSTIDKPNIMEYRNNEYIFKVGDKPDYVYIILQGKVKLLIPDKHTGTFTKLLLNRGQIFGE